MRKIFLPLAFGSMLFSQSNACDQVCKDNCAAKNDLAENCMRHCGCDEFQKTLFEWLDTKGNST